jgi:hypothetical protein
MAVYTPGTGSTFTEIEVGDFYISEDTITGRDDLTSFNMFIESKGTGSFVSMYNDVFVGGDSTGPFTDALTGTYTGSDFSVYGSYVSSDPTTRYGMFWTSQGTDQNTLTIYGNIRVVGNSATFVTEETVTSDAVITLGAPIDVQTIDPTTKDLGIEFKWNTSAITSYSISAITAYSATQTIITLSSPAGYLDDTQVIISGSNSTPNIDGVYTIIRVNDSQFIISTSISSAGNTGSVKKTYNTGFFGFDYTTNRFIYFSDCENINDSFEADTYGDAQFGSIYTQDRGIYFGDDEDIHIYLSSNDLLIENNVANKDIIFKANDGSTTNEIMRIDGSAKSVSFSNDVGITVGTSNDMTISVSGSDIQFLNNNSNGDFNFITKPSGVETSSIYLDGTNMFIGIKNSTPLTELDVNGSMCVRNTLYFGNATTNGSWKYVVESGSLNVYKRIGGIWILKQSIRE